MKTIKIDLKDLEKIRSIYKINFESKEKALKLSREIRIKAKEIIFACQRNEKSKAEKKLSSLKEKVKNIVGKYELKHLKEGLEEYAEAIIFFNIIYHNKLCKINEIFELNDIMILKNNPQIIELYIGGLSDATGELVRLAVKKAIKKEKEDINSYFNFVEKIYSKLLKMDISSSLRKKIDSIKYNLEKLANILYDLNIKHNST